MTLPLLLSVPHAGLMIPPIVKDTCLLVTRRLLRMVMKGLLRFTFL